MSKKKLLLGLFSLMFIFGFVQFVLAADLDIGINAKINNYNTDLYLKTSPSAITGFDVYDFDSPSNPSNYSQLYSSITGHSLIIPFQRLRQGL